MLRRRGIFYVLISFTFLCTPIYLSLFTTEPERPTNNVRQTENTHIRCFFYVFDVTVGDDKPSVNAMVQLITQIQTPFMYSTLDIWKTSHRPTLLRYGKHFTLRHGMDGEDGAVLCNEVEEAP